MSSSGRASSNFSRELFSYFFSDFLLFPTSYFFWFPTFSFISHFFRLPTFSDFLLFPISYSFWYPTFPISYLFWFATLSKILLFFYYPSSPPPTFLNPTFLVSYLFLISFSFDFDTVSIWCQTYVRILVCDFEFSFIVQDKPKS